MTNDLAGQHLVVVGGSSGIGLAVAAQAAATGARVTVMGRDQAKTEAAARRTGATATRTIDLRRPETIAAATEGLGTIDHLAITAGTFRTAKLEDSTPEEWRQMLEERLIGPLTLIKALTPSLTRSIVLCSGTLSQRPSEDSTLMTSALAGVESACRALARELAPVRVNVVTPGAIDTPLLDGLLGNHKEAAHAAMAARLPVGRIGSADDVAQAFLFLMTNQFITGAMIRIDGGSVLI
jgi:NAD(P)-dependent dehydrogenase (short-subunit alcohol dehydrogenase family)